MSKTEEEKHQCLLKKWQKRLGLEDWRIKLISNVHMADMNLPDSNGCTSWVESTKCAKIQILDEREYGDRMVPFNFERTLVHELLHLKLSLLDGDDLQGRIVHQLIDDLARAFVAEEDTDVSVT